MTVYATVLAEYINRENQISEKQSAGLKDRLNVRM